MLAEWKSIVDSAAQTLIELHNIPSYEFLMGASGSPKVRLTGVTEARVGPAMQALEKSLRDFGLLSDTIQRAVGMRQQISRFPGWSSEQKIQEIERLLMNPSIANGNGSAKPANQGGLISPRQLLAQMNDGFRVARDSLQEVDRIWKQLDAKLASAAAFLRENQVEPAVEALRKQVDGLRSRVINDPIGADIDFDRDVQPVLTRVRTAMESLVKQRANVRENLQRGRDLLRRLVEIRHEAEESFAECKEKITAHTPPTPPLPPDRIAALYEWLTRLEAKLAEGQVDPVCVGLENWMGHVTELITVEERACLENRTPLELRRELRGRLTALRAKAHARGFSEDQKMTQIAERANLLLHSRPTPMKEVSGLVTLYESRLNGRG